MVWCDFDGMSTTRQTIARTGPVDERLAMRRSRHGSKLTDGVKEVMWSGDKLADDNYDEFVFASRLTEAL
jgi:hypothetical protein